MQPLTDADKILLEQLVEGILQRNRMMLSRAITLAESRRPAHQALAQHVLALCLPHTGRSLRIGITGAPGAGKSSFIETFGSYLTQSQGRQVAVLAVDPSSQISLGSILGDKTRMEKLATDPAAYIRPSPSGDAPGGVAARTREAMLLCEAAGFDTILVETVGVGQAEVAVQGMVDFLLLLLVPGAGDELQGIKRGIVEMADLLAVNKADGDRLPDAQAARLAYAQALHLFPAKSNDWQPPALLCSALTGNGLEKIWDLLLDFQQKMTATGWLAENRRQQNKAWLHSQLQEALRHLFHQDEKLRLQLNQIEREVMAGRMPVAKGVGELMKQING